MADSINASSQQESNRTTSTVLSLDATKVRILIGRDPFLADCVINMPLEFPQLLISRVHCVLVRSSTRSYYIADLNSTNGTTLNGSRLHSHSPQRIEHGDVISFCISDDALCCCTSAPLLVPSFTFCRIPLSLILGSNIHQHSSTSTSLTCRQIPPPLLPPHNAMFQNHRVTPTSKFTNKGDAELFSDDMRSTMTTLSSPLYCRTNNNDINTTTHSPFPFPPPYGGDADELWFPNDLQQEQQHQHQLLRNDDCLCTIPCTPADSQTAVYHCYPSSPEHYGEENDLLTMSHISESFVEDHAEPEHMRAQRSMEQQQLQSCVRVIKHHLSTSFTPPRAPLTPIHHSCQLRRGDIFRPIVPSITPMKPTKLDYESSCVVDNSLTNNINNKHPLHMDDPLFDKTPKRRALQSHCHPPPPHFRSICARDANKNMSDPIIFCKN
jgi:hypothetical protein